MMQDRSREAIDYLVEYEGTFQFLLDVKRQVLEDGRLPTERQITGVLKCKAADIRRQGKKKEVTVEEGMYRIPRGEGEDADIYKVQRAVNGSGRLYAKRLVMLGKRSYSFVYEPGGIFKLGPEHRMTLEEARQFGKFYGSCIVCGRTLTDEISIERGIGPVCEQKGRWR